MTLYQWPDAAAFGRIVPKQKIYENGTVPSAVRDRFVAEVAQIRWAYKLAPDTTRLPATDDVREIQVFRIQQRVPTLALDILETIDRAIPSPIFFELEFDDEVRLAAAYKRPHAQIDERWVTSEYFLSRWWNRGEPRRALPHSLDLRRLYQQVLIAMIDRITIDLVSEAIGKTFFADYEFSMRDAIAIETRIVQLDEMKKQVRALQKLEKRVQNEVQFNRRVALNSQLKRARHQLVQAASYSLELP